MHVSVDHIVLPHTDLNFAAQLVANVTGIAPSGGGSHHTAGTRNIIFPLGASYLELVTVDDHIVAAGHPFGQLVTAALDSCRWAAGWAVAGPTDPVRACTLERAGVAVSVQGCDEAAAAPDRPFILERPSDQPFPGDTENPTELTRLVVTGPDVAPLALPPGPTELVRRPGPAAIESFTLARPGLPPITLNRDLWSTR